jgi:hypothetical protein
LSARFGVELGKRISDNSKIRLLDLSVLDDELATVNLKAVSFAQLRYPDMSSIFGNRSLILVAHATDDIDGPCSVRLATQLSEDAIQQLHTETASVVGSLYQAPFDMNRDLTTLAMMVRSDTSPVPNSNSC